MTVLSVVESAGAKVSGVDGVPPTITVSLFLSFSFLSCAAIGCIGMAEAIIKPAVKPDQI